MHPLPLRYKCLLQDLYQSQRQAPRPRHDFEFKIVLQVLQVRRQIALQFRWRPDPLVVGSFVACRAQTDRVFAIVVKTHRNFAGGAFRV